MVEIVLRPYQDAALDQIRALIASGVKNILLCAPTGSGKTVIASKLAQASQTKRTRLAFVVDRINLVDQTSDVFSSYGIEHGVLQSMHWRWRPYELTQLCSAQTLQRRGWPQDLKMIVVDECHTSIGAVHERIGKRDCVTVGLTATPFTRGLGRHYDALVNVCTTNELIEQGYLSPYRIFAPSEPDMTGVRVVGGEWDEAEASQRALAVVGDCVTEYLKHGDGRKFICSAVDVAHVEELQRQFMAAGVNVAAYTYRVKDDERAEMVREFRKTDSTIRGLITVTAATKGFDVPDIGVVIMARPLRKSLAEHIQFFGRGLRVAPGKSECIVLDHSGNCARFWQEWQTFFAQGATELCDGKKKPKPAKKKDDAEDVYRKCPQCKHLHAPAPFCPQCGHAYPAKRSVEHVAGTLREIGGTAYDAPRLWAEVCGWTRERHPDDLERARKRAYAMFADLFGAKARADFWVTTPVPPSPALRRKIKAQQIAFAKRRYAAEVGFAGVGA